MSVCEMHNVKNARLFFHNLLYRGKYNGHCVTNKSYKQKTIIYS